MAGTFELEQSLYDAAQSYAVALDVDDPDWTKVEEYKDALKGAAIRYATASVPGLAAYLTSLADAVDALGRAETGGLDDSPETLDLRRRIIIAAQAVVAELRG